MLGEQLGTLSHWPRRRVLVALLHHHPRADTPVDRDDPAVEEDLEVLYDFQRLHLPELEDGGFIDYDREERIVSRGPNFPEIEPLLGLIDEHRDELPDDWL